MAASKKTTSKKSPASKPVKVSSRAKAESKPAARGKPAAAKPAAKPKPERKSKPTAAASSESVASRSAERVERPSRAERPQRVEKIERLVPPRPAPVRVEEPPTPSKPAKPAVDAEWMSQIRDAMVKQRQELLSVVSSTQAQMAEKVGDLPDVSDRASEGFEDELAVGLIAIEAAKLDDIEAAIQRIDDGSYGLCVDCGRAIPRKRLEVLPFARRCLTCEGQSERRTRAVDETVDDDDSD
jgi:RNA polymerase-binding protein DksA